MREVFPIVEETKRFYRDGDRGRSFRSHFRRVLGQANSRSRRDNTIPDYGSFYPIQTYPSTTFLPSGKLLRSRCRDKVDRSLKTRAPPTRRRTRGFPPFPSPFYFSARSSGFSRKLDSDQSLSMEKRKPAPSRSGDNKTKTTKLIEWRRRVNKFLKGRVDSC